MVDFSGSFGFHVPLALYVPVFFEGGEHGVYGAGSEVYSECFADFGDDLVAVHGLLVEELEDDHVEESFGEFGLDFFLVVFCHFFVFSPCVFLLNSYTICLFWDISSSLILRKPAYKS